MFLKNESLTENIWSRKQNFPANSETNFYMN